MPVVVNQCKKLIGQKAWENRSVMQEKRLWSWVDVETLTDFTAQLTKAPEPEQSGQHRLATEEDFESWEINEDADQCRKAFRA